MDHGNGVSITRCVRRQRGMLLTHRMPFCGGVWHAPIAEVIRELDCE